MKKEEIKQQLIADAQAVGICSDGLAHLQDSTIDDAVGYYVQNPNWGIERNFPTLEFIAENFADCEDMGVFVNKQFKGEVLSGKQTYILHNCKGHVYVEMDYKKRIIPMLYLANGSRLSIRCNQQENKCSAIIVPIYVDESSQVKAKDNYFAKYIKHTIKRKDELG